MAEGERGEDEGASESRKMGATRYVLGSAILGLFWSSLLKGVLTNSTSRCDYPPCSCDHYGRLTCDCKEEGEVGSTQTVSLISIRTRVDFRLNLLISRSRRKDSERKNTILLIKNIDLSTFSFLRDKEVYFLFSYSSSSHFNSKPDSV